MNMAIAMADLTSFHFLAYPIIHTLMFPKSIPNKPTCVIALDMLLSSVIINSITPIKPDISSHENVFYASPMGAGGIHTQPIK